MSGLSAFGTVKLQKFKIWTCFYRNIRKAQSAFVTVKFQTPAGRVPTVVLAPQFEKHCRIISSLLIKNIHKYHFMIKTNT